MCRRGGRSRHRAPRVRRGHRSQVAPHHRDAGGRPPRPDRDRPRRRRRRARLGQGRRHAASLGHHRGFLLEAISGLDTALWDLRAPRRRPARRPLPAWRPAGDRRDVRLERLLPGVRRGRRRAPERLAGEGHRRIKIKIGHRPEQGGLRRDIATVRAICSAVGAGTDPMLDANGTYTLAAWSRRCAIWRSSGSRSPSRPTTSRATARWPRSRPSLSPPASRSSASSASATSSPAAASRSRNLTSPAAAASPAPCRSRACAMPTTGRCAPTPASPAGSTTSRSSTSPPVCSRMPCSSG
ncbi:MAG: hypothetical protein GEU77_19265 [Deltaproteobacteria bacterium]|nr:hypothetical protein [Deltaproteobacteria bacterium]MPZ93267.1 hypothetical protein [Actinomycetota bacterium]